MAQGQGPLTQIRLVFGLQLYWRENSAKISECQGLSSM